MEIELAQSSPLSGTKRAGRQVNFCPDHAGIPCRSLARLHRSLGRNTLKYSFSASLIFQLQTSLDYHLEKPRLLFYLKGQICFVRPGGLERAVGGVKH